MGFAAVARVTDATWTACAVHDNIDFGLKPGGQLELNTTLCFESRAARAPIVIDQFSKDAIYGGHHTAAIYRLESYISMPIITAGGKYFGNLCAIDPRPAKVNDPRVIRMFEVFANLIAMQLESEQRQWSAEAALVDERATARLREQFIAVLGHDLRNPLAAVEATAELMVRGKDSVDWEGAGRRLKRTVQRMSRLIDDVLDFARGRLGSGMVVSVQTTSNLNESLQTVVDELRLANPSRHVDAELSVVRPCNCDVLRIQQLLSNLLGNALTHGAEALPVYVRAAADAHYLTLSVSNGGEPIPPSVLPKVFEPYWRPPSSAPGGGLGLGLYICQQIVQAHHGTLEACSTREDGTCFTARIPINP